jgi:glutamate dehydrogenase/leucine dehydrogenase
MVLEGANMPSTNDAISHFHKCGVVLAAAKACNAGGVAVSGLEMAQNACMTTWSSEQVDERLKVGDACVCRHEYGIMMPLVCRHEYGIIV